MWIQTWRGVFKIKRSAVRLAVIFVLVFQPFFNFMAAPGVGAASVNVTKMSISKKGGIVDGISVFIVSLSNDANSSEQLDVSPSSVLILTSDSPTGSFTEGETSAPVWQEAPTYTFAKFASKTLRYKDTASGRHTIAATLSGGGLTKELSAKYTFDFPVTEPIENPPSQDIVPPEVVYHTPDNNRQKNLKISATVSDENLKDVYFKVERSDGKWFETEPQAAAGRTTIDLSEYDLCTHTKPGGCDTSWMTDGLYKISAIATDVAGNSTDKLSPSIRVNVDTHKPTLTAKINGDKDFSKTHDVLVTGMASDEVNGSGLAGVKATAKKVGSSDVVADCDLNEDDKFVCVLNLGDGEHLVTVTASDAAGNVSAESRKVIVDAVPPTLTIDSQGGQTIGGEKLAIMGTVRDENFNRYEYFARNVNGDPMGGMKTSTVPVTDGELAVLDIAGWPSDAYSIVFTAYDWAGNMNTATYNVTIDHTAPIITAQFMNAPTMMAGSGPIVLQGAVTGGFFSLKLLRDGENYADLAKNVSADGSWSYIIPKEEVAQGTYNFSLVAADAYGNASTLVLRPVVVSAYIPGMGSVGLPSVPGPLTTGLSTPHVSPLAVAPMVSAQTNTALPKVVSPDIDAHKNDVTLAADKKDDPAVAATKNGWVIFGIAWYWWALATGAIGAAAWKVVTVRRRLA